MSKQKSALLIFTKAPVAGQVKTRLLGRLGAEGAAQLYAALIRQTLLTARASSVSALQIWATPDIRHPLLQSLALEFDAGLYAQHGNDLGERMHHAISRALADFTHVLLVGCDIPMLRSAHIDMAVDYLSQGDQFVLGPAEDGGYYLIGSNQPCSELFMDVEWGSDRVLPVTRERLQRLKLCWSELPLLWDLDRAEDLDRYQVL